MIEFYGLVAASLVPPALLGMVLRRLGRSLPLWATIILALPYMLVIVAALEVIGMKAPQTSVVAALGGIGFVLALWMFRVSRKGACP